MIWYPVKRLVFNFILASIAFFAVAGAAFAQEAKDDCLERVGQYSAEQMAERKQALCTEIKVESGNPLSGNCDSIVLGACRYFKWCVACHGPKADGVSRFDKFAADLTRHWRGYGEFVGIVLNGAEGNLGRMPPWQGVLNVQQISEIGAYLETLAVEGKAYWK